MCGVERRLRGEIAERERLLAHPGRIWCHHSVCATQERVVAHVEELALVCGNGYLEGRVVVHGGELQGGVPDCARVERGHVDRDVRDVGKVRHAELRG
jgi:hypothetical protein